MNDTWKKAQTWEADWLGNAINSLYEEEKQIVYAEKMGLVKSPTPKTPYNFDLEGKSILDIGGGAYSLLLKCVNLKDSYVVDPLMSKYPAWVIERYREAKITPLDIKGEEVALANIMIDLIVDECWVYNVLEHTYDPKKVIENALQLGNIVRIFEWIETRLGVNDGHIHSFTESQLNEWLGGKGKVEVLNRGGARGKAYYGVFKGNNYATSSD